MPPNSFLSLRATQDEPFILHNVDIVSTIDIGRMVQISLSPGRSRNHRGAEPTNLKILLFDEKDELCGRRNDHDGKVQMARPAHEVQALAYACIQVISPRLFTKLEEDGAFPIFDSYLRLAARARSLLPIMQMDAIGAILDGRKASSRQLGT